MALVIQKLTLTVLLVILITGCSGSKGSTGGKLIWAKSAGGATFSDQSTGITVLSDDSTVVTGLFAGSATFGQGEPNQTILTSSGGVGISMARYNSDGTLAWAKSALGNSNYNYIFSITSLSDDSIVLAGWFNDSIIFAPGESNQTTLVSNGNTDIFIARYNSNGTLVWVKQAGGTSDDHGLGITTLSDDTTVVTGTFGESATFGAGESNQTNLDSAGYYDVFIARYRPDGTLYWAKQAGGNSTDEGFGVKALSDNSTVVTGYFQGSATFGQGESNQTVLTAAGGKDIFVACYHPTGTLAWAKCAGGSSTDQGSAITALSDNTTMVTGFFHGSAIFGQSESNQTVLTSSGDNDIFIARFNHDGTLAWATSAGGYYGNDFGSSILRLSDDTTVIAGIFHKTATFGSSQVNQTILQSVGDLDVYMASYNPNGTLNGVRNADVESTYDYRTSITSLSDDSIVITGTFFDSATFGAGTLNKIILTAEGSEDIFIARFAP